MKQKLPVIFLFAIFSILNLNAQTSTQGDQKTPLFGITLNGYIKTDVFYDSRQTINLRDGHFLLYPDAMLNDAEGKDINARGNYNILNIQTRIKGMITGPDALGARTSGMIEAEFFGNSNPNINTFRLRHAFVKLTWPTTELLAGQTWHPMFNSVAFPNTVSFNTGAPFVVFSRNPQVRLTQKFGNFSVALAALSQVDFMSAGPGGASTSYLRNSMIPEFDLQLQYYRKKENGSEFLISAGADYLGILPRLSSDVVLTPARDTVENNVIVHINSVTKTYKTDTRVNALSFNFIARLKVRPVTCQLGAVYGENTYAFTMLGGYAVKSITDPVKGLADYANIRTLALWGEIFSNGRRLQTGIFGGFSRNLGIGEEVTGPYYARGSNIGYLYRISPRVVYNVSKVRFALELEYTGAGYGKTNEKGYVYDTTEVDNLRVLLGVYYFF